MKLILYPFQTVTLDAKDLSTLLKDVIPKWSVFGINLDIPPPVLDAFKDDKPVDQLFREMLGVWMKGNPYWQDLVEALKQIGNRRLAMQIENKYIKEVPGTCICIVLVTNKIEEACLLRKIVTMRLFIF